jgi:hypothetical protein
VVKDDYCPECQSVGFQKNALCEIGTFARSHAHDRDENPFRQTGILSSFLAFDCWPMNEKYSTSRGKNDVFLLVEDEDDVGPLRWKRQGRGLLLLKGGQCDGQFHETFAPSWRDDLHGQNGCRIEMNFWTNQRGFF